MKIYLESVIEVSGIAKEAAVECYNDASDYISNKLLTFARWAGTKALEMAEPYDGDYGDE